MVSDFPGFIEKYLQMRHAVCGPLVSSFCSCYIKNPGFLIILIRPDFHRLMSVVIHNTVLCHGYTWRIGVRILCYTLQDHERGGSWHYSAAFFRIRILISFQLACDRHKSMIPMTIAKAVRRIPVFICDLDSFLAKVAVFIIIFNGFFAFIVFGIYFFITPIIFN